MKKLISLFVSIIICFGIFACQSTNDENSCLVRFVQKGQKDVIITVEKGSEITSAPVPVQINGYDIVWDVINFDKIENDMVINAIITPKEYTITYDLNELKKDKYIKIDSLSQKVVFNENFSLIIPTCYGYNFIEWKVEATNVAFTNGKYKEFQNIKLIAKWKEDKYSDRWWTDSY